MALKRIQKVSGAEPWEGAERFPCPRVVVGAALLLLEIEAAAGAGSARGVAAATAARFLCQDSSFPRRQPGWKSGCETGKGGLSLAVSRFRDSASLKAPRPESVL